MMAAIFMPAIAADAMMPRSLRCYFCLMPPLRFIFTYAAAIIAIRRAITLMSFSLMPPRHCFTITMPRLLLTLY